MQKPTIKPVVPPDLVDKVSVPENLVNEFVKQFKPTESGDVLIYL